MLSFHSEERIRSRQGELRRIATSAEEARRRRAGETMRLRQDKREEAMAKRRREVTPETGNAAESPEQINRKLSELPAHLEMLKSTDPESILNAVHHLRLLLSLEHRPPIQQCVDAGIIPRLVNLLKEEKYPKIQFEACWALTNIASGSSAQTATVVEAGAVELLIKLMSSKDSDVRGQSVWALANISGDGPACRDYVLRYGIMKPLLALLNAPNPTMGILRDATWTLSNLCRGKDAPWDIISPAAPILSRLLYSSDADVLADACWSLVFMSDSDTSRCQYLLDSGIGPQIVSLLKHPSLAVQLPALRVVGNILFGEDEQTQPLINMGVLSGLGSLIHSEKKTLRKEACWCLSNIAAGTRSQIQALIDSPGMIDQLCHLSMRGDYDTSREATLTLSNAFVGSDVEQVRQLFLLGALEPMCHNLSIDDSQALKSVLEGISNILACGRKDTKLPTDTYATKIELYGGVDKMEDLHQHEDENIWNLASKVLTTYWVPIDENSDPNITPEGHYSW